MYKGIEYPIVLRLLNDSEPQQNGEIRIVDNPLLTNRIFKVRGANSDRIEINPWIDDADKLFNLSCIILAHAVHGKGFFPSPGKEKKNRKYRRRLLDIEG
ncbi:MAG: hypothetical protein N2Z85_01350 [Patescibacteria group bacterium]|nr:hypothetical protein [Patescibacteria group bacterium]